MPKIILGLTGSFGSGKSTVAGFFKALGAKIIDADKLAHKAARPEHKVYKRIVRAFGLGILDKNKRIDRKSLAGLVFKDKGRLLRLNRIVHPQVIRLIKREIETSKKNVIVLDAPLLIEAGLRGIVDKLIVVKVNKAKQVKRAKAKYGLGRQEALSRINSQMPLHRKVRLADFVIDNNRDVKNTKKEVLRVWRRLWKN
ncbi:MAG TPA: dephospho-CoA kinase [Candidatus Omnitrophota bacterium]|nr:dephospho-CoA kinase [Candidatus Omnitrophota bacterium]